LEVISDQLKESSLTAILEVISDQLKSQVIKYLVYLDGLYICIYMYSDGQLTFAITFLFDYTITISINSLDGLFCQTHFHTILKQSTIY